MPILTGRSDVTVTYGRKTISILWGNMEYCMKLNGEEYDLLRCSNKTESVGLLRKCPIRKYPYYH